jgi:hypothetical protein
MANHEDRPIRDIVHLFLAFKRKKLGNDSNECMRVVIKDYDIDLDSLEYKCKLLGGTWRIHRTVNARDTEKARIWLVHKLIDNPEFAGCIDSLWRTALLQKENAAENKFMFDVDANTRTEIEKVHTLIEKFNGVIRESHLTKNGIHIITLPFDAREVCKLSYVTLMRDGYYFIKEINEKE